MKKSNHNKANEFSIIQGKERSRNFFNDKGYDQFVNYSYGLIIKTFTCSSRKEVKKVRKIHNKYCKSWVERNIKRGVPYY